MIWRREELPPALKTLIGGLGLAPKAVLSWAKHPGGYLVATSTHLISHDTHETQSIAWSDMLSATWDEELLTVLTADNQSRAWKLPEARDLPMTVRDFVTRNILADRLVDVAGVGPVRFVARRTTDGVNWLTISRDQLDDVQRAQIASQLAQIRENLGI